MQKFYHSVTLDKELCKGCTNCVKRCPTEAIRVRGGKAEIIKERCIDCGECIRLCPSHAKRAVVDSLDALDRFPYTIALPAPSLYGQFSNLEDLNILLTALTRIGFDEVFEVSVAAEAVSAATRRAIREGNYKKPVISSACPAVLRIIRVRFPELIDSILDFRSPMELAARWAKRAAAERTGLSEEQIGAIFISPCPAKSTSMKSPLGTDRSAVDAVVAISEVYPRLLAAMKEIDEPEPVAAAGGIGIGWGSAGGESAGLKNQNYLAADGIENVIRVLEALEDDKIPDVDFVELNACVCGCVGGVMTVESPFIARARLKRLTAKRGAVVAPADGLPVEEIKWDSEIFYEPVMRLDEDISVAMKMLGEIKRLEESFNGMDCGACGAPSCRALAEDIVRGFATEDLCIYRMREKLQGILRNGGTAEKKELNI